MAEVRRCGICKLALREDDSPQLVRIKDGDLEGVENGLYSCCSDCMREHRPKVAARLDKPLELVTSEDLM